jgi:hypothetical protein
LQDPPKFTQIWIFGLKTNHLATLLEGTVFPQKRLRHNPDLQTPQVSNWFASLEEEKNQGKIINWISPSSFFYFDWIVL